MKALIIPAVVLVVTMGGLIAWLSQYARPWQPYPADPLTATSLFDQTLRSTGHWRSITWSDCNPKENRYVVEAVYQNGYRYVNEGGIHTPDGRHLTYTIAQDGTVKLWDMASPSQTSEYIIHDFEVEQGVREFIRAIDAATGFDRKTLTYHKL